jgi:predicted Ser/Thr protein kinase
MNQLSGKIPVGLGKCVNLLLLDLSYNMLSGEIPREIVGLANLAFYFNLSNNLLEGSLHLKLSKMTMVQAIDISANRLTGYIPSGLGSCKELEYLNLSCNSLEGPIPMSLGELQSLQCMDFSSNNLSGGIPTSLENLKMLNQLNFSFNNLSGEVPKGGVFKNLSAEAFMGNPGLCGPWVNLSMCSAINHKSVSHLKKVVISSVAVAVTIVLCLFVGILWRQNHKRNIPIEVGASLNVGHRRISYAELITATNGFSDANLLGVGSFGKVYKGVLNDGTVVAVKLLNLENEGAHKSFKKECKVLGRVRHRNLIRVITSYSDLQMKALIFPFMPNGSLEKWLYPDGEVESGLTLIQRLNIAIDIAQGMAYLHHHCFMQVIHCDLKPNNVLLGEDMTAYLIDFGIATICFANDEDSTFTSTLALKGSTGYIPPGII